MKPISWITDAAKESVIEGVREFVEVARINRAAFCYGRCFGVIERHTLFDLVAFHDCDFTGNITININIVVGVLVFR